MPPDAAARQRTAVSTIRTETSLLRRCSITQTWAALREQGIRTPEVAAWQRMPAAANRFSDAAKAKAMYPYILNIYNAPAYSQVSGAGGDVAVCVHRMPLH